VPPRRSLHDHAGRRLDLGPELASGGEGVIYLLANDPARLAKVYHKPPSPETVAKLRVLVRDATPELCKFAGWPTATLHEAAGSPVVGFVMPKFTGYRAIHTLYSPAHRRATFPHADWTFLVHTALNCAAAFDAVHARGYVVGDVNQSNVLVSEKALVALIDCDSFQVRDDGQVYRCEVGVSQYTPPELQGRSFRDVTRTANHDRFGLAVLIFHLLFMGRHPFAGRFLGSGEMPLEQAIQEFRFAYGPDAAALQMTPPPHALPLAALAPDLQTLFVRALGHGGERDGSRPAAAEWHAALAAFEKQLRVCPIDPGHRIPAHLAECPWCVIVRGGGPNFFLTVAAAGVVFTVDTTAVAALWARIERVPQRAFTFHMPQPGRAVTPTPIARTAVWLQRLTRYTIRASDVGFWTLLVTVWWYPALALFGLTVWFAGLALVPLLRRLPANAEAERRRQAWEEIRAEMEAAEAEWHQVAGQYQAEFARLKERLRGLCDEYAGLQGQYDAERPDRDKNRKAYFQAQFLRSHFLSDYKIPGIGPNREVLLASYGVETAYDVEEERILAVRGMGPVLTGKLLAWKKKVLKEFRFDPKAVVPEAEMRAVVFKYKQLEDALRSQLQRGAEELEALGSRTEEQLRAVEERLAALALRAAQAEVDWEAIRG
jgi:DNA-binding helix-hairpin-helix protein with protein kinase domain